MPRLARSFAYLALVGVTATCSASSSGKATRESDKGSSFTLFATTELLGNIEPCGCTSDPMGDLSRTVALIAGARSGKDAVIYVDGGSTLFAKPPLPAEAATQTRAKADLLFQTLTQRLHVDAVGLGATDLAMGPEGVRPPRQAANVPASAGLPLAEPTVVTAGGVKVGIFGATSPTLVPAAGPVVAPAKAAVARLRTAGAQVVVGLAYMPMREARDLAREVDGIDIIVVGADAPEPNKIIPDPGKVGSTWLVQPANRGQVVTRMDVTVRGGGSLADALGPARAKSHIAALDARIPELEQQLAKWEKDPTADPDFVATQKKELADAKAEKKALETNPLQVPDKGSWFVMQQVQISKGLPCDAEVQSAKTKLDEEIGKANLAAAKDDKPVPPEKGHAGYSGLEECGFCHGEAVKFWKKTRHARAWKTLVNVGKQWSYDCIGCHVTGWKEPGGSTLSVNDDLRNVQCEVCHGPGSIHVDADGKEKPLSLVVKPPAERCQKCHSPEHSDTFDYDAYLRDVTGPGHGEKLRKELGDGPTGHELREAALKKVGADLGPGCKK